MKGASVLGMEHVRRTREVNNAYRYWWKASFLSLVALTSEVAYVILSIGALAYCTWSSSQIITDSQFDIRRHPRVTWTYVGVGALSLLAMIMRAFRGIGSDGHILRRRNTKPQGWSYANWLGHMTFEYWLLKWINEGRLNPEHLDPSWYKYITEKTVRSKLTVHNGRLVTRSAAVALGTTALISAAYISTIELSLASFPYPITVNGPTLGLKLLEWISGMVIAFLAGFQTFTGLQIQDSVSGLTPVFREGSDDNSIIVSALIILEGVQSIPGANGGMCYAKSEQMFGNGHALPEISVGFVRALRPGTKFQRCLCGNLRPAPANVAIVEGGFEATEMMCSRGKSCRVIAIYRN